MSVTEKGDDETRSSRPEHSESQKKHSMPGQADAKRRVPGIVRVSGGRSSAAAGGSRRGKRGAAACPKRAGLAGCQSRADDHKEHDESGLESDDEPGQEPEQDMDDILNA